MTMDENVVFAELVAMRSTRIHIFRRDLRRTYCGLTGAWSPQLPREGFQPRKSWHMNDPEYGHLCKRCKESLPHGPFEHEVREATVRLIEEWKSKAGV